MTLPSQRGRTATAVSRLMKRFSREERGVVAIEFALIAPLLVALLLGTTSLTNSIWANGKVDHTANVIGDLVAQSPVLTDATTGNDSLRTLMAAAPGLMVPFASTGIEVTVTEAIACHVDPTADDSEIKFFVVWSRSWSDGSMYERSGYAHASDLPESPGNLRIGNGDYLVVTELAYEHHPPITISSTTGISMKEVAFHQPRDNSSIHFEPAGTQNNVGCSTLL